MGKHGGEVAGSSEQSCQIQLVDPKTVQLSIDMKEYCRTCKDLIDMRAEGMIIQAPLSDLTDLENSIPEEFEARMSAAEEAFKAERTQMQAHAAGYQGETYWIKIKKLLSQNFNEENPSERFMKEALLDTFGEKSNDSPHVLNALNTSFVELLKNSMDAFIRNYLINPEQAPDKLMMEIHLDCSEESVQFRFKDNGCGFPQTHLDEFEDYIQSKSYREPRAPSEKYGETAYYFGGAGKGLRILYSFLLDGVTLGLPKHREQEYDIPEGSTRVSIFNDQGAGIELMSPVKPFALTQTASFEEKAEESEEELELAPPPLQLGRKNREPLRDHQGEEFELKISPDLFGKKTQRPPSPLTLENKKSSSESSFKHTRTGFFSRTRSFSDLSPEEEHTPDKKQKSRGDSPPKPGSSSSEDAS